MSIFTLVLAALLLVVAALLWGWRRAFAWIAVAAAVLFALPVFAEWIFWIAWVILLVVAFLVPPAHVARAAKIFTVVVLVFGVIGFALTAGGIDIPFGIDVHVTGLSGHFQNPVKDFNLDLQPPYVAEPTPTPAPGV